MDKKISCCEVASASIKEWVKEKWQLKNEETVLVSVCGECEQTAQTLIMIIKEQEGVEKLCLCKVEKMPQAVRSEDISSEITGKPLMDVTHLQYKGGRLKSFSNP